MIRRRVRLGGVLKCYYRQHESFDHRLLVELVPVNGQSATGNFRSTNSGLPSQIKIGDFKAVGAKRRSLILWQSTLSFESIMQSGKPPLWRKQ